MKRGAMKNISLAMLARQIGVGVATVDRVLNERGGVSPQTTRKVLQAAREAGLKRILPEEHRFPWQIEVFLSSNDSFFFPQLAQDFAAVADSLGYRRLTLHRTFVPESQPTTLARRIARSCQQRQGIIVFGNDHPAVHDALHRCREAGVPAITLATDLPGADRLCHVGINQLQAGRTAGLMLGRMTPRPGEVLMVSGRQDLQRASPAHSGVPRGAEPALSPPAAQRRAGGRGAAGADHPPGGASPVPQPKYCWDL